MNASLLQRLSLLLALLWVGLISYLSHQPGPLIQQSFPLQDKLMHFAAFSVLGLLGMGAARVSARGYRPAQAWGVCLLAGLYGIADELHQSFIPGRVADPADLAADIAGAMAGAWLLYYLVGMARRRAQGS